MKKLLGILIVVSCLLIHSTTAWTQISLTSLGSPYSQTFDGLPDTGSSNPWQDNSTIPGWYASRGTFRADSGGSNIGAMYSYGSVGNADRALGGLTSNSVPSVRFGVRILNNTGSTIGLLNISYTGEEWRQQTSSQLLVLDYQVDATSLTTGTWTSVSEFNFMAPKVGTAGSLDGNAPGNRAIIPGSISMTIPPGHEAWLRWTKTGTNSPGLAIDDFSVTGEAPIPLAQYYSKPAGDLEVLGTWGTNSDGSGAPPADFTSDNQTFAIANNSAPTIGGSWVVSGNNSRVILGDNTNPINFTIPVSYAFTGSIDLTANSTLTLQNDSLPTFGAISSTSTTVYAQSDSLTIPAAPVTYGSLVLMGGSKKFSNIIYTIGGNLIADGVTSCSGSGVFPFTWINLAGDFILQNSASIDSSAPNRINLNCNGASLQTLKGNGIDFYFFRILIDNSSGVELSETGGSSNLFLIGGFSLASGNFVVNSSTITVVGTNSFITQGAGTLRVSPSSNLVFRTVGTTIPLGTLNLTPTFQTLHNLTLNATGSLNSLTIGSDITIAGTLAVENGTLAVNGNLSNAGVVTIDGAFQLNTGSTIGGIGFIYGANGTLIFNNTTTPYIVNDDPYWPSTNGPWNVLQQNGGGIQLNVSRSVGGTFSCASGGVSNGNNLTLGGTVRINTGGFFISSPTYSDTATLVYNSNTGYTVANEWTGTGSVGSGVPYNVTIQNNTNVQIPSGDRGVPGNLTIISGALALSTTDGNLYVGGDWTNQGTFTANSRSVVFNSTTAGKTLSGSMTGNNAFYDLALNGVSGGWTMSNAIEVLDTLSLVSGTIITDSNNMVLGTNATLNEVPGTSVLGGVTTTRFIPGTSGTISFGNIGAEIILHGVPLDSTTILRTTGMASSGAGHTSILRSFTITPATNVGLNADLVFHYREDELNGQDPATLKIYKSTDGGSTWTNRGGDVDTANRSITINGVDGFSHWTVSNDANSLGGTPVPVISGISPTIKNISDTSFTLTVTGSNFIRDSSVVHLDGGNRPTTYVNETQLTALVPSTDMAVSGIHSITVFTSGGGGESNGHTLTVIDSTSGIVSGTVFNDVDGNGVQDSSDEGLPNRTVTIRPAQSGNAVRLDGVDDYISVNNESNFDFAVTDSFTIETWINSTSVTEGFIFAKQATGGEFIPGYELRMITSVGKGVLELDLTDGGGANGYKVYGTTTFNDGQWHHVAATYDGSASASGIRLYVDGNPDSLVVWVNTSPGNILNNLSPAIGSRGGGLAVPLPLDARLDEFKVWHRQLSRTEIAGNMHHRLSGSEPGLIAYYNMDTESDGFITDHSGHGNTGFLNSGASLTASDIPEIQHNLTNSNGAFSFSDISPGDYLLEQVVPIGWKQTHPDSSYAITMTGGDSITGKDFGSRFDTVQYASVWNASSHKFPNEGCFGWTEHDNSPSSDPVFVGDTLVMTTTVNADDLYYDQVDPSISIPAHFVIEFRMKYVSGTSTNSNQAPAMCYFATGANRGGTLGIDRDRVFLWNSYFVTGPSDSVDTDANFHTYRIVVINNDSVNVFYDSSLILVDTIHNDPIGWPETTPRIYWGDGGGLTSGETRWLYFKQNASVYISNASISGIIFNDKNANGVREAGDSLLANWKIILKDSLDVRRDSTLSDLNGNYSFSGLCDGLYAISEGVQEGWIQSYPRGLGYYTIRVLQGQNYAALDFGNVLGFTYNDTVGGLWSESLKWTGGHTPGPTDPVIIPRGIAVIVDTLPSDSVLTLQLQPGSSLIFGEGIHKQLKVAGVVRNDSGALISFSSSNDSTGLACYADFINYGILQPGHSRFSMAGNRRKAIINGDPLASPNRNIFYVLDIDGDSTLLAGNVNVHKQLALHRLVSSTDTVNILSADTSAIQDSGTVKGGTVLRSIMTTSIGKYRFDRSGTFVQFYGSGVYPSQIAMTTHRFTKPDTIAGEWVVIPSRGDPVAHMVTADSISEFSRWAVGIIRPTQSETVFVDQAYDITAAPASGLLARFSFGYDWLGFPDTTLIEDSLLLFRFTPGPTSVHEIPGELPHAFMLMQNYPNPFNPTTVIQYQLPIRSHVTLRIFDVLGRLIATLVNDIQEAGTQHREWRPATVASGVYFYRIEARSVFDTRSFADTKKMLIIR